MGYQFRRWLSNSTVTIINTQTDTPVQTIAVVDNPSGIVKAINGRIWVLCSGIFDWVNPTNSTDGSLVKINPANFTIETRIDLTGSDFGSRIAINNTGTKIFFSFSGSIYSLDVNGGSGVIPSFLISKPCCALGIDTKNGDLYFSDPIDLTSQALFTATIEAEPW